MGDYFPSFDKMVTDSKTFSGMTCVTRRLQMIARNKGADWYSATALLGNP